MMLISSKLAGTHKAYLETVTRKWSGRKNSETWELASGSQVECPRNSLEASYGDVTPFTFRKLPVRCQWNCWSPTEELGTLQGISSALYWQNFIIMLTDKGEMFQHQKAMKGGLETRGDKLVSGTFTYLHKHIYTHNYTYLFFCIFIVILLIYFICLHVHTV